MTKDVVYVDQDDEISTVADNIVNSKSKVVALVLPKRCTMLHSAVNMKILNKAAAKAKKQIVLITNEQTLLPIAGASGIYIAKTLKSKPAVPNVAINNELVDEISADLEDPVIDPTKAIGDLADEEEIDLPDDSAKVKDDKKSKDKKDKKLKVPNFESFRSKLFLGVGIFIGLMVIWYIAAYILPKAKITVTVQQNDIPVNVEITAASDATDNVADKSFKLETKSINKDFSKKAEATGSKNVGEKAGGTITITNCESSSAIVVPAGALVTASGSGGYKFITDASATVPGSNFSGGGQKCDKTGKVDVTITAVEAGGNYNLSARAYSLDPSLGLLSGYGDNMSGGTDKTVKIITAEDCDGLKGQMSTDSSSDEFKKQLVTEFEANGLSASLDTYKVETVSSTCEPAVGQEATQVTAKSTYKYTLSGVSSKSLGELITQEALKQAGQGQTIIDTGLSKAVITVDEVKSQTYYMTVKTTAITGVNQDAAKAAELVAGKNAKETSDTLKQINGVKDVKVEYSPFWVNKTPKNTKKITVTFVTASSDGN